jgi:hypothetical protein
MTHLALVDSLYAERYGAPGLLDGRPVSALAQHAPALPAHGPAAICHADGCRNLSSLSIEVPFRGRRRTCGIHIDAALDHLGVTGTADVRITRIAT